MLSSTRRYALPLITGLTALLSCEGGTQLTSPVVREDLRDRLPARLQQLALEQDAKYDLPCQRDVTLSDGGASQELAVLWRVMSDGPDRYITAVSVEAKGPTRGAHTPTASAALGEVRVETGPRGRVGVTPLTVSWQARSGCNKMGASKHFTLRADDPSCKEPKAPTGLLKPVE